ncbi:MAG: Glucose-6-phosphate isomerase [Firmicutes bacterium]|nr:Glucose-6-phosphate isomerase [Bacillota bacterium]MBT9157213.1 Glucose-6-phosphate isomerase [Bacillota bacterium]
MVDLKKYAYLDVKLSDGRLQFGEGLVPIEPACRYLDDARYAFLEANAVGFSELYYMYRDVARNEDRVALAALGLRYDITVIMPGLIGREYNKTVGHYHPVKRGTPYTYPEVYEVLHGEATYLLQRPGAKAGTVEEALVMVAQVGDKVVIPPDFGHITINAKSCPLVMANWVAAEFSSVYGEIKELQGGAYYLVVQDGAPVWVPNPNYAELPEQKISEPRDYPEFGMFSNQPMYKMIFESPEKLRFLTHPESVVW